MTEEKPDQAGTQDEQSEVEPAEVGRAAGLGAVFGAFSAAVVGAFLFVAVGTFFTDSMVAGALLVEVGALGGVVAYLAATRRRIPRVLRLDRVPTGIYPLALKLGFVLLLANFAATVLLGPPARDIEFVSSAASLAERIALAVGVVLLAPVIEEALFRGMLQGVLETRLRHWYAIALAGLAFALLHGRTGALFFFAWSLPVGWVTWRCRSIRPAIAVHAINNVVGIVGLFWSGPVDVESVEYGVGTLVVAAVLLVVACYWVVRLCLRVDRVVDRPAEGHPIETTPMMRP
jgi:membrane protease YdiL (CAAX protease family)